MKVVLLSTFHRTVYGLSPSTNSRLLLQLRVVVTVMSQTPTEGLKTNKTQYHNAPHDSLAARGVQFGPFVLRPLGVHGYANSYAVK